MSKHRFRDLPRKVSGWWAVAAYVGGILVREAWLRMPSWAGFLLTFGGSVALGYITRPESVREEPEHRP